MSKIKLATQTPYLDNLALYSNLSLSPCLNLLPPRMVPDDLISIYIPYW